VNTRTESKGTIIAYAVAIVGAFLIMAGLVVLMRFYTRPTSVDAKRSDERRKASLDLRQSSQEQMNSYGFVDAPKGQVRLPIERAMELVVQEWKNPEAGRSNLLARVKHFNPPPPPAAPPPPSPFE
jgi:hypothetical protein